ncbi:MAG TPA: hypothetical protein VKB16_09855, partial [Beijerinckiaceae bacterium]|nr:hypothetical protein [Beijerinckiaceae bacterium]
TATTARPRKPEPPNTVAICGDKGQAGSVMASSCPGDERSLLRERCRVKGHDRSTRAPAGARN